MRLCSYTITNDAGFAPNPFGRFCTLAACTPNHQGIRLSQDDWLVGHATADRGHGLIYAMKVSEILDFDTYYHDPRFEYKKPRFDRTWREVRGDNIYYLVDSSVWKQHRPTLFHGTPQNLAQDTRHPRVFISKHFYYFGAEAPAIPERFCMLIRDRQGCKCSYPEEDIKAFVNWLQASFETGVHADPRDLEQVGSSDSPPKQLLSIGHKPSQIAVRKVDICGTSDAASRC
jgi:Nucleotide modification associated domain 2